MVEPIDALKSLEGDVILAMSDASMEQVNEALEQVKEDMLVLRMTVDLKESEEFYLYVKMGGKRDETVFEYLKEDGSVGCNTRNRGKAAKSGYVTGPLSLKDNVLEMEIYIDRSLIEAYFNNMKSISVRSYAEPDSVGIRLEADTEIQVKDLSIAPMQSIYE